MKIGAEIPKDDILPQLPMVLNTSQMRRIFQELLFPATENQHLTNCNIKRVKYKPGKNCLVCYQLDFSNNLNQQLESQWLSARIFEKGGAIFRYRKAHSDKLVKPKFGDPLSYIPNLEMVIWAFPNDRKLDEISTLTDPVSVKADLLSEILGEHGEWSGQITNIKTNVVHYVPEHTCMVRVNFCLQPFSTRKKKDMTLFGKTYYNEDGVKVFARMQALWNSQTRRSGRLKMAQPLGYHKASKSLWQMGLSGPPLLDREMNSPDFLHLLGKAASTVSVLHTTELQGLPVITKRDLLDQLQNMEQLLSEGRPTCKKMLNSLVERLKLQAKNIREDSLATLHGDLHLNNFIVEGEKIALIDMDNLSQGSPLLDLGSFFAGILYRAILTKTPENQIEKMGPIFLQHYQQAVPWKISPSALRWYVAMMLINERAFRCFTRLKAGRLDILDQLVALADRISMEDNASQFTLSTRV